jgi:hypothetical protein
VTRATCTLADVNRDAAPDLAVLAEFVGTAIATIERQFYVYGGDVNREKGPVEFTFRDGRTLRLEVGGDGESLKVLTQPWVDPFPSPLSAENAEFVASSGRWTRFDVSATKPYVGLIGGLVIEFVPIVAPAGKLVGVVVATSTGSVSVECDADEVRVTLANAE